MVQMLPLAEKKFDKIKRFFSKDKGATKDSNSDLFGYKSLLPTKELLKNAAKKSGFNISFVESRHLRYNFSGYELAMAVFEKH